MRLFKLAGACACLSVVSGCSTIYVANVKFTAPEICSEELASRLHPNSGCLPPTRFANVQRMYLERFRPQVSPSQAVSLDAAATDGLEHANFLPSLLGRVFVASASKDMAGWVAPPVDGNLEFLPIGDVAAGREPEREMQIEVNLRTDLRGAIDSQVGAGASADASAIVDGALGAVGVPTGAATQALHDALVNSVVNASAAKHAQHTGTGTYMYVTLTAPEFDSLNHLLAVCDLAARGQAGASASEVVNWSDRLTFPPVASVMSAALKSPRSEACGAAMDSSRTKASTKSLVSALMDMKTVRPDVTHAGIITGIAILRTKGKTQLCSDVELGLVSKGTSPPPTSTCAELKAILDTGTLQQTEATAAVPAMTEAQKAKVLLSISAQFAQKTYKDLDAYAHTSVLAFHWIPIRLKP